MSNEMILNWLVDYLWIGGMGIFIAGIIEYAKEVKWSKWWYIIGGFVLITLSIIIKNII